MHMIIISLSAQPLEISDRMHLKDVGKTGGLLNEKERVSAVLPESNGGSSCSSSPDHA